VTDETVIQLIAFFHQHDIVNEAAATGSADGYPWNIHAGKFLLQRLEQ
jgi:hypothetical protein